MVITILEEEIVFKRISTILTLFALFFASHQAQAQYSRRKKNIKKERRGPWFQITPVVGYGSVSVEKANYFDPANQAEFSFEGVNSTSAGLLLDFNSHKAGLALQTGLIYQENQIDALISDKNQQINIDVQNSNRDQILVLPLMVKFYPFSLAGKWFYLRGGANLTYLMDSKSENKTVFSDPNNIQASQTVTSETSGTDSRRRFDVQGVAGLGVAIPFSRSIGMFIEGNYQHGFIDSLKDDSSVIRINGQKPEIRTRNLIGLLGLTISL